MDGNNNNEKRWIMSRFGGSLYIVGLGLFTAGLTFPAWVYDWTSPPARGSVFRGLSMWDSDVRLCFGPPEGPWRCYNNFVDMSRVSAARVVMCLCVVVQTAACVVVTVNNVRHKDLVGQYFAESLAGLATQLAVTSVLIFHSVTHYGVNLTYGPGFVLTLLGMLITYIGLVLTGLSSKEPELYTRPAAAVCNNNKPGV